MLGGFPFFPSLNRYRMIVVTPARILLLDTGVWGMSKATDVVVEWPRATRLGPTSGALWHVIPLGDSELRVHRRFFKDIEAADAAAGQYLQQQQQQYFQPQPPLGQPSFGQASFGQPSFGPPAQGQPDGRPY